MDLREKKTKRSIKNAFMELRARKPLERITVKELAELAEISKATFYLHYQDIYDLSDCLQKEVIQNILNDIKIQELSISNLPQFAEILCQAFHAQETLINILFSGSQSSVLPTSIEKELKEYIFRLIPERKHDARFNILLSYHIQGGFYAYQEHYKEFGIDCVMDVIKEASQLTYIGQ